MHAFSAVMQITVWSPLLVREMFLVNPSWLSWGLRLTVALALLARWGQEWAGMRETLALTHKAHVVVPAPGEVALSLVPAPADVSLVTAGCWHDWLGGPVDWSKLPPESDIAISQMAA